MAVITGLGAGLVSPVLPAAAMAATPTHFNGVATAITNCARQLGLALGVAVLGSIYHQHHDGLLVFTAASTTGLLTGAAVIALLGARRITPTTHHADPRPTTTRPAT